MELYPFPIFETPAYAHWVSDLTLEDFLHFVKPYDPCEIADLRSICAKAGAYQVFRLKDHQVLEQLLLQIQQMDLAIIAHPKTFEGMINFWLVPYNEALDRIWWMEKAGIYPHEAPLEHYQPLGYAPDLGEEDRARPPSTAQTPSQLFNRSKPEPTKPATKPTPVVEDTSAGGTLRQASAENAPFCETCAQLKQNNAHPPDAQPENESVV